MQVATAEASACDPDLDLVWSWSLQVAWFLHLPSMCCPCTAPQAILTTRRSLMPWSTDAWIWEDIVASAIVY